MHPHYKHEKNNTYAYVGNLHQASPLAREQLLSASIEGWPVDEVRGWKTLIRASGESEKEIEGPTYQ